MNGKSRPLGFSATGLSAGLSKKKNKKDMALFISHLPANGAAVFTNNQVKAAPIVLSQERLLKTRGHVRAVIVNSGSANAATGRPGLKDAETSTAWVAQAFDFPKDQVWAASTGVIGTRIRPENVQERVRPNGRAIKGAPSRGGLDRRGSDHDDRYAFRKDAEITFEIDGVPVRMWGCAKGAGMIHPDLRGPRGELHATMLVFHSHRREREAGHSSTGVGVGRGQDVQLRERGRRHVDQRFRFRHGQRRTGRSRDHDGKRTGLSCVPVRSAPSVREADEPTSRWTAKALHEWCKFLFRVREAKLPPRVAWQRSWRRRRSSRRRAMAPIPIGAGSWRRWGVRAFASFLSKVKIWLGDILVCDGGVEKPFSEPDAIHYLKRKRIVVRIDLGLGHAWSHYKTCDFHGAICRHQRGVSHLKKSMGGLPLPPFAPAVS